ncbi:MAG: hypothetical protein HOH64_08695 [Rhodospirillales bacterium]|jgi:hypothetical protein|nr:hypothetical protein [Rhodospirillales bacterium]MBT5353052.1 hypothetical protein [Rhodospirillales bacterium]MBT6110167.1 hypothetical protein [Rhodospirillales bacterium]MBT6827262.1 hypothetical protein [Rhodospirillales bacterium]
MKKIVIGLCVVVVAVAGGMFFLSQNAPKIIKAVIEDQGSAVTQVSVSVSNVDLSLTDLKAGIRGLVVGNPDGFKTPQAISLGEVSVKISDDWTMDTIVVEEVMISAPEITYEIGSNGSNIDAIQSNVEKVAGGSGSSDSSSSGEDGPKVVINDLYIKGGKINISASFMDGSSLSTDLPDIHLTDIGKESGGASPAEVADEIISAITKYSSSAASGIDLSSLGLADISGKAADVAGEVGDTVKDAAEEAGGLLEGLLGN